MTSENDRRPVRKKVLDCRQRRPDTLIVRNSLLIVEGDVKIGAHKYFLPLDINIFQRFFAHVHPSAL